MNKPVVLIVLDGWGFRADPQYNAIAHAHAPMWQHLLNTCPHTLLHASGERVGLPAGQMGNSEVGHLTLGAGRILYQDLTRIDRALQDGSFQQNPVLLSAFQAAQARGTTVHLLGLLSPGGVHSHEDHILAALAMAAQQGVKRLQVHAFLDGRDTPPKSAQASLNKLQAACQEHPIAHIASLSGRYFAMDRDKRFERIEPVYRMLCEGIAPHEADNAQAALAAAYERQETDEFVTPTWLAGSQPIQDGDTVIFMNFRSDRARELSQALINSDFQAFARPIRPQLAHFITLTEYADDLPAEVVFPAHTPRHTLGEYLQTHGRRQLRLAETEKYAHVTFFFNGGQETPYGGEDRILIPSPRAATYDTVPAMSALAITDALIDALQQGVYDLIVVNYANADMVGHTGDFAATQQAIEALDACLQRLVPVIQNCEGQLLITADHGNAECMFDEKTQQAHTAHTCEQVPFIYLGKPARITHQEGSLADVAPTVLYVMGLTKPTEMTGTTLLEWL